MTKRVFRTIFAVAVSVFLACTLLFMTVLYDYFSGVQQRQLRMQTDLAAKGVQDEAEKYLDGLDISGHRITWIDTDGSVLYDSISDTDSMENHLEREEVREAVRDGYGESSRYSSTLTERYLYCAKRLSDGTVIRLSVTQNSLLVLTLGMLQPIIVIFIVAVILSAVLASRLSKKIVQPLNELNLDEPLSNDGYDELSPLLRRIDTQQRQIKKQSDELKQKQNEFETVTRGMAEGIILLNGKGTVLSINRAAELLFDTDHTAIGKDIISVSRDPELSVLLQRAAEEAYAEKTVSIKNGVYRLSASSVTDGGKELLGTVLLMLDVTEKESSEQMRREFTANVSHELKTPLHTISGCAELLANGMVKPEDVTDFSKRIYTEAGRTIRLVEDIIKLSHLDEGADDMKREETDLSAVAAGAVAALAPEAEKAEVKTEFCGEPAVICGIPQLISSIVYNLCDNAVKYNHKGGSVTVTVKNEEKFAVLSVADTGIGIPEEHRERIFERFYRVDKSHSKEIGGTGLGLSIVKHAARLHGALIELRSAEGQGTTVTVKFPKDR